MHWVPRLLLAHLHHQACPTWLQLFNTYLTLLHFLITLVRFLGPSSMVHGRLQLTEIHKSKQRLWRQETWTIDQWGSLLTYSLLSILAQGSSCLECPLSAFLCSNEALPRSAGTRWSNGNWQLRSVLARSGASSSSLRHFLLTSLK